MRIAPVLALLLLALPVRAQAPAADGDVAAAVLRAWEPHLPPGATVEVVQTPRFPDAAGDGAVLEVDPPGLPVVAGVRPVTVSRRVDGRINARGLATVHVRREVAVWIAGRDVPARATLGADDVRIESRVFDREPTREQTVPFTPARWSTRRPLAAGAVVRSTDVTRLPDVAAGRPISLVVKAGDARVDVPSVVRRAGNIGETILVSNPVTGAMVSAVLVDADTAELTRPAAGRNPVSGGTAP